MELRWTGSSGRPRGGETPHSCPPFELYYRRSGLSSVLSLERRSLFDSEQMTGRARDACANLSPACSHYHWTRRAPSIGPGTTHGPRPYPRHYPTSGQGIFSSYKLLADRKPSEGPDAWIWSEPLFSVRVVYNRLRD